LDRALHAVEEGNVLGILCGRVGHRVLILARLLENTSRYHEHEFVNEAFRVLLKAGELYSVSNASRQHYRVFIQGTPST